MDDLIVILSSKHHLEACAIISWVEGLEPRVVVQAKARGIWDARATEVNDLQLTESEH